MQAQRHADGSIELIMNAEAGDARHAIIWLHGLGATADDFPPIVPELGLDAGRAIRFVFPQAPNRPITINGGMVMPGWYDIKGLDISDKEDEIGMGESKALLDGLIETQIAAGILSANIIVAGFSQGGAVAYHTALRSEHKLGGMLTLSTYLPFAGQLAAQASEANKTLPIFASHGTYDPVVPVQLGKASVDALLALDYTVDWRTYPMEHQVVMEQIKDIGAWINLQFKGS